MPVRMIVDRLGRCALAVATALALQYCAGAEEPAGAGEPVGGGEPSGAYRPMLAEASDEAIKAIPRIRVPDGLRIDLVAAEPLLANPVAMAIDERGRFYIAETHRLHDGVTDIRDHMDWLNDDLACRTVEDRVEMMRRRLGDTFQSYARHHDRIRLVEDTDGDGLADRATVYADGFDQAADGIGAGLLARNGDVWYTCIPHLWLLKDADHDGQADVRSALHSGYGVHVGFLGHDLHGLCWGPDGKIYFSIGDRGLNVSTPDATIVHPDAGAVLRSNADGSDLEVFATGLRNPQELAFDQYGNLFTGDNNSDGGDRARWVWVVRGGDSGWRIGYQFIETPVSRGVWNSEKMWQPATPGQPAFIVPPIANLGDGPSGLCYYPGSGLSDRYREHFFLCDFRGSSGSSGIRSFALAPKGASFEVIDQHEFAWSVLATDADFGIDHGLYFTDWVEGWNKTGKGRIYRVVNPAIDRDHPASHVRQLIGGPPQTRSIDEWVDLLAHEDMRVRQHAQFALAAMGLEAAPPLARVASDGSNLLARLHAIWGLGQLAAISPGVLNSVVGLLADKDAEVRAQAARLFSDHQLDAAVPPLVDLLVDPSPRVRFHAALALANVGRVQDMEPVIEMLRSADDQDPYLRHAGVMALASIARTAGATRPLLDWSRDASPAVRMGVLLALRRLADPAIREFLSDADPEIVAEAARAIHDLPIDQATADLAALLDRADLPEPAARRAINANFRLGQAEHAAALAAFAGRPDAAEAHRIEALECLQSWHNPSPRDRITGLYRPPGQRDQKVAAEALLAHLGGIFSAGEEVRQVAARVAAELDIREVGPQLLTIASDRSVASATRAEALLALKRLSDPGLRQAVEVALSDDQPRVRAAARQVLAAIDPDRAVELLAATLSASELEVSERQAALATLGSMQTAAADALLSQWLDRLAQGAIPPELELDVAMAVAQRGAPGLSAKLARYEQSVPRGTPLEKYRESLLGGDAQRGQRIFFHRSDVSCLRCHKIRDQGGEVGPDLSRLASDPEKNRQYLLESIVDPNRHIAKGFDTVVAVTDDGLSHVGVLKAEDETTLTLVTAEGRLVQLGKESIDERAAGQSAMPDKLAGMLSKAELRDLVEFLSTLK